MEYLELILKVIAGLVGFPAFLSALLNVLKRVGWLKDGQAPAALMIGHLIAYVAVAVAVILGKVEIVPGIDVQLGLFADVLLAVLAFLSSLGIARGFHENVLFGLPGVGFSHTSESYKKGLLLWEVEEDKRAG